jgi:hypothetical protein
MPPREYCYFYFTLANIFTLALAGSQCVYVALLSICKMLANAFILPYGFSVAKKIRALHWSIGGRIRFSSL